MRDKPVFIGYMVGASIVWLIVALTEATGADMLISFCTWVVGTPIGIWFASRPVRDF